MVQVEDLVASAGDRGGRRRRNAFCLRRPGFRAWRRPA